MAFSFTPTQPQSQEGQAPTTPQAGFGGATPLAPVGQGTAVSYPDSPWLILHDRDKDPSIGAYVQLILALVAVLSVILSASIYGYSVYLTSQVAKNKVALDAEEGPFKSRGVAKRGDTILLSPGAASFGIFKNEFDRGDQFVKLVKKLV